jgi:hypothetical protein
MELIEQLQALEGKTTEGPWRMVLSDNATPHINHMKGEDFCDCGDLTSLVCVMPAEITMSFNSYPNGKLMALAPQMAKALLAAHKLANAADMLNQGVSSGRLIKTEYALTAFRAACSPNGE